MFIKSATEVEIERLKCLLLIRMEMKTLLDDVRDNKSSSENGVWGTLSLSLFLSLSFPLSRRFCSECLRAWVKVLLGCWMLFNFWVHGMLEECKNGHILFSPLNAPQNGPENLWRAEAEEDVLTTEWRWTIPVQKSLRYRHTLSRSRDRRKKNVSHPFLPLERTFSIDFGNLLSPPPPSYWTKYRACFIRIVVYFMCHS